MPPDRAHFHLREKPYQRPTPLKHAHRLTSPFQEGESLLTWYPSDHSRIGCGLELSAAQPENKECLPHAKDAIAPCSSPKRDPQREISKVNEERDISARERGPKCYRQFLQLREYRSRSLLRARSHSLGRWFASHALHPYPSKEQKDKLANETGMTRHQVSEWFGNMRRRVREATGNNGSTWQEKIQNYNSLITDRSDPLPLESTKNDHQRLIQFSGSHSKTNSFKKCLLNRYISDSLGSSNGHSWTVTNRSHVDLKQKHLKIKGNYKWSDKASKIKPAQQKPSVHLEYICQSSNVLFQSFVAPNERSQAPLSAFQNGSRKGKKKGTPINSKMAKTSKMIKQSVNLRKGSRSPEIC